MASGAEGLAGLSVLSGGGGAAAQLAKRPKAINGIDDRLRPIMFIGDLLMHG